MANTKTIIEINGNKYDASTGLLLEKNAVSHAASGHAHQALDGVHRPSIHHVRHEQRQPAADTSAKHYRHPVTHNAAHHKPQRSQTLMRSAVKKPVHQTHHPVHSHDVLSGQSAVPSISPLHSSIEARRLDRARSIGKSNLISKFSTETPGVTKKTSHVPVKPEPPRHNPLISRPSIPMEAARPEIADVDPIIRALESARHPHHAGGSKNTHRHVSHKFRLKKKAFTIAGSTLLVVLLAGFIAYQKMPDMAMRVAAAKAGFDARLPEYRPAGFNLADPIQYGPGEITINFKSSGNNSGYRITQRPSKWDSETLLDKFVNGIRSPYQTYQGEDKTIFIYNDSDATWVEDGIWYQITGNGGLTSDQLLRIASSL